MNGHERSSGAGARVLTPIRGIAYSTAIVGLIHSRFMRAGRPRARRGRARIAFCRSKSNPSAPEHCGRERSVCRNFAAGAERRPCECKKTPIRYIFVTGAEKGVRGKAPGLFPEGAHRAPGVRGGAWRSQAVKPCIKKRRRPKVQNVCGVGVRYAYVCDECGTVSVAFYAAPEPLTRFF